MPKLRESRKREEAATQVYRRKTLAKILRDWGYICQIKKQQSCIQLYVSQNHEDNLARKAFDAFLMHTRQQKKAKVAQILRKQRDLNYKQHLLNIWQEKLRYRMRTRETATLLEETTKSRLLHKFFTMMRNQARDKQMQSDLVDTLENLRARRACHKVIRILQDYARCQQSRRASNDLIQLFRKRSLFKKSILGLKMNKTMKQNKNAYSKLFSIFTAWKNMAKENRLLGKYLAECNY